ncbi:MAG: gamma-glutamylcyclotransferase [Hyphomicrobiaceae bacterium]
MTGELHRIFVYGTLKRGFPNHHYMRGATYVGDARTVDAYPLVVGGVWFTPYLIPEKGDGHRVKGEVWDVPDHMMPALDKLESVHLPNGYRRQIIAAVLDGASEAVDAWTYFRQRQHIPIIHTDAMDDYQDRRYKAAEDRDV